MPDLDLTLKLLGLLLSAAGVLAAIYNIATASSRAKQVAKERHDAGRLDDVCVLAAKNEQRLNGLEGRHNSLEARVDRRLEQIAGDVGKVKDLFTDFLINKNH